MTRERVKLARLTAAATEFREAARMSRLLYQTGASSVLDVLDAERSLYAAEDALLQSRTAITTNYIALNKALGGGWDGPGAIVTSASGQSQSDLPWVRLLPRLGR